MIKIQIIVKLFLNKLIVSKINCFLHPRILSENDIQFYQFFLNVSIIIKFIATYEHNQININFYSSQYCY